MPCLIAPLASLAPRGSRLGARLLRRRSQTIRRVCSFLLTAAGRDAVFDCSARFARSARIAPWSPPTSSSLADDKACLLVPPHPRRGAMPCLIAPLASLAPRGSRLGARLLRRRSQTIRRVCSFLLTAAGRDPTLQLDHIRDDAWRSHDLGCYSDAVAGIERRWALLLLRCRSEAL